MKICFFIATLDNSGGTERAVTAVAGELLNYGYDVSIICWWGGSSSFFPLNDKVKLYSLYGDKAINIYSRYLSSFLKYRKLVRSLKPDVIVDVCVPLSLITIPATRFTKIKTVSWEQFNMKVVWKGNLFTAKASRWLVSKYANKIVVLTHTDELEYKKRFHSANQYVIPNPVTIPVIRTAPLTSKKVLAVGRLTFQKGFDLLLPAWQQVMANQEYAGEARSWTLTIVGGGEDESKLKNLCTSLGLDNSVTFVPPSKQIETFYLDTSIFVMSSRFEGLPLALVEAKAFGLPTISFDCETGPREVISHEEDGLLVEPENIPGMANAITRLINDPAARTSFGAKSVEKAKKYKLSELVKDWDTMFRGL